MQRILGLDIGGANLKAAHSTGAVAFQPFPLWKQPAQLPDALRALIRDLPACDLFAVTMTGELCDCFATKREGVHAILGAVEAAADERRIRVWTTEERFVDVPAARQTPLLVAAANWLALARFAGRFVAEGTALLIDIGSTTTDIIPLDRGRPVPVGRTDTDRLASGELVYTGVERTPVCALLGARGAAELFAMTQDVYLALGMLPESADDCNTADGRPATTPHAHARLARMLCGDTETLTAEQINQLVVSVLETQRDLLRKQLEAVARRLPELPRTVILAGAGEFLARHVLNDVSFGPIQMISLADRLGPEVSRAACAHALTQLAIGD